MLMLGRVGKVFKCFKQFPFLFESLGASQALVDLGLDGGDALDKIDATLAAESLGDSVARAAAKAIVPQPRTAGPAIGAGTMGWLATTCAGARCTGAECGGLAAIFIHRG
jgi:hypothetical protein